MQWKKLVDSRVTAVVAGATVVALIGAGAGYSASTITSADIKDKTIKVRDIRPSVVKKLRGQTGPAGPAGPSNVTRVTALGGQWTARSGDEAGIKMTGDGVQFGPFADGGDCTPGIGLARLDFSGMNGQPLRALKSLVYRAQFIADDNTFGVGSPTMRVFFAGTTAGTPNRLTFSPNTQFNNPLNYDISQGAVHEWIVTSGTVRFNDDAGSNPAGEAPWSSFLATYGDQPITNINILNGCQAGTNLRGIVREVDVNGQHYEFGG